MTEKPKQEKRLSGITICPGIGFGKAQILDRELPIVRISFPPGQVEREQKRYTRAVKMVGAHLDQHVKEAHSASWLSGTQILKVHKAILDDRHFHDAITERIAARGENAEWALFEEAGSIISRLEVTRDPYFQARAEDIRDLAGNILHALSGAPAEYKKRISCPKELTVVLTGNLYPSTAVQARKYCATGFATESRLLASHAAILLKGFGIPAVGAVKGLRKADRDGERVIVDGYNGKVILRPTEATWKEYQTLRENLETPPLSPQLPPARTTTRDGTEIHLAANIESPEQVELMFRNRLAGIGLFRTEFLALSADTIPGEEEQYEVYRRVIEEAAGRRVVIRRHLLCCPEELRVQLRAILRAAVSGEVGILLPMVTTVEDIRRVKRHLEVVRKELGREKTPFSSQIALGAMIEVPAAAFAAGEILSEVDFISVGTNDLLQYFLAVDRDNPDLVEYGEKPGPGFLALMGLIIGPAIEQKRAGDVSICGEMAADPSVLPGLIRLGYRTFSISPVLAPAVRAAAANTDLHLPAPP